VRRLIPLLREKHLVFIGQAFPQTVDDMKPVLKLAVETGIHHLDVQPDIRPRRLSECVPLLEGWLRLAEHVDVPAASDEASGTTGEPLVVSSGSGIVAFTPLASTH